MYRIKATSGTGEWAGWGCNLCRHCKHGCLYCYQAASDLENGRIKNREEWLNMVLVEKELDLPPKKLDAPIMLPTGHDLFPEHMDDTIRFLSKWLAVGNEFLIVTKPHLECVKRMCDELADYKSQILFRFTIGSTSDADLKFWEPNAPLFNERLDSLKYAFEHGFKTSVSSEPMLGGRETARVLYDALVPYVTDAIWFGKMNKIDGKFGRVKITSMDVQVRVDNIKRLQSNTEIMMLYNDMKDKPKIKWKESIKRIAGLPLADKPGTDK